MRKVVVGFFCILFSMNAKSEVDYVEIGKFSIGALSTIVVHELGHAAAIEMSGGDVDRIEVFDNGLFSGQVYSNKQSPFIYSAGLLTTSIVSEFIIQNEGLHDNPYAQGFLFFSLLSNVWHVKDYYTNIRGEDGYTGNDIDGYEISGGNPHILSAVLISYSAFSIYRIKNETDIIPFMKKNMFGISLKF